MDSKGTIKKDLHAYLSVVSTTICLVQTVRAKLITETHLRTQLMCHNQISAQQCYAEIIHCVWLKQSCDLEHQIRVLYFSVAQLWKSKTFLGHRLLVYWVDQITLQVFLHSRLYRKLYPNELFLSILHIPSLIRINYLQILLGHHGVIGVAAAL